MGAACPSRRRLTAPLRRLEQLDRHHAYWYSLKASPGTIKGMKKPVYLDYLATTPVDPRVVEKMTECLSIEGNFGNPASRSHL